MSQHLVVLRECSLTAVGKVRPKLGTRPHLVTLTISGVVRVHDGMKPKSLIRVNGVRVETSETASRPEGRVRSTRQAAAVQEVLSDADGFRTVQQLHEETRARGLKVGLATVYRYLNLFAANGLADVVHRGDGEAQYRLCGTSGGNAESHHHHVVCRECGRSVEVSGPEVEAWADRVAAAAGYTKVSHTVEVFGLCPQHSVQPVRPSRRRTGSSVS